MKVSYEIPLEFKEKFDEELIFYTQDGYILDDDVKYVDTKLIDVIERSEVVIYVLKFDSASLNFEKYKSYFEEFIELFIFTNSLFSLVRIKGEHKSDYNQF
tara:strand:+ start:2085 stop:2387 length:303 start_codon:yes stop_codon:yes gene_type:complete